MDRSGNVLGESHKIHMVPFGEYLPFGDWLGWLSLAVSTLVAATRYRTRGAVRGNVSV